MEEENRRRTLEEIEALALKAPTNIKHCQPLARNHIRPHIEELFVSVLLSKLSCPAFKKIIRNAKSKEKM